MLNSKSGTASRRPCLWLAVVLMVSHVPRPSAQCQYRNGYIYECTHNQLRRMSQLDAPLSPRQQRVTVLDISYNRFAEFDAAFLAGQFPGIRQLLAADNAIARLVDPGSVVWPELRSLKLSRNRLETLGRNDLAFGTGLVSLQLDANRLQSLSRGCFSRCHNLSQLSLEHNRLDYVHSEYFWGLWTLERLFLGHNQLTGLPSDTFGHLHRLTHLDLGHNRIKALSATALRGLPALTHLNLAANQLADLPLDALHATPALTTLDASGNQLRDLYAGSLADLPALERLLLNGSEELRLIDAGAFARLPRLRLLDASSSTRLRYVSVEAFIACPMVAELRLSGCPLAVSPVADWHRRLPRLSSVDVHDDTGNRGEGGGEATVLDLFPSVVTLSEGHRLRLPCRSYPEGRARWKLPAQLTASEHLRRHHLTVTPRQDLLLHDAFEGLSGVYACVADGNWTVDTEVSSNDHGGSAGNATRRSRRRRKQTVAISVKRMESRLLLLKVTENSIVVTWQKLANPDDYVLMYRPRGAADSGDGGYHRVRLRSYMRRYAVSSLRPDTRYQLCLALRTYSDYQHLHCILVATRSGHDGQDRDSLLFNGRIVIFLVAGIGISVGVLVACLVACSLSRDKSAFLRGGSNAS